MSAWNFKTNHGSYLSTLGLHPAPHGHGTSDLGGTTVVCGGFSSDGKSMERLTGGDDGRHTHTASSGPHRAVEVHELGAALNGRGRTCTGTGAGPSGDLHLHDLLDVDSVMPEHTILVVASSALA